jgi:predicted DNA-binding transcriptional regulator YafY
MEKSEPFERRIEIIKLLHGRKMRTGELAEHFVDDRTIRADIDSLRMGMDVLGVKIKIESKHEGSQKHYYISTVHPIMLALNLSELLALLKLLENSIIRLKKSC